MRSEQTPTAEPEGPDAGPPVEVDVARTGGFAGITRRWTAQPPEDEASEWISLIDRCPWDETSTAEQEPLASPPRAPEGDSARPDSPERQSPVPRAPAQRRPVADGFVWWIRASWSGVHTREAELPDDAVTGAWRELVDAVREWNRSSRASDDTVR